MDMTRLRGIGVSPGIAMGEVLLPRRVVFTSRKELITEAQVLDELKRLHQALDRPRDDLVRVKESIREKMGPESAFIFEAHLLILEDPTLVGGLEAIVRDEKARAEWALSKANTRYEHLFESLSDDYFRQRKSDVSDVLTRVYRNLEIRREREESPQKQHVLVAHELLPSAAARREFQAKKDKYENYGRELQKTAKLKSETLDRARFTPLANIELPEEVSLALSMGAEGVGLFRSEFIYLRRESLPSEEDHFEIYSRIARGAHPHPVTIRPPDLGG